MERNPISEYKRADGFFKVIKFILQQKYWGIYQSSLSLETQNSDKFQHDHSSFYS